MQSRRFGLSALIGIGTTFALLALAFWVDDQGLARALFWQNTLLQNAIPGHNIGTSEEPVLEGTPVHLLASLVSIPLGCVIYGATSFLVLGLLNRRS